MHSYRFYFLDGNDHIKAVETIDCISDAEAARKAADLLAEHNAYEAIEVWKGKLRVHQARRT
jgi:hypothetical protein